MLEYFRLSSHVKHQNLIMEAFIQVISQFLLLCAPMWAAYHRVDTGSYSPGKFLCKTSGTSEQTGRGFRVTLWRKFSMQQFKIRSPGER